MGPLVEAFVRVSDGCASSGKGVVRATVQDSSVEGAERA